MDNRSITNTPNSRISVDICAICLDQLTVPKQVTCGHRFCEECVGNMCKYHNNSTIKCPLCRQSFPTIIPVINPTNIDDSDITVIVDTPRSLPSRLYNNQSLCENIIECIWNTIKIPIAIFLTHYLGKLYVIIYCGTQDKSVPYGWNWNDYSYRILAQVILGVFISAILVGCCVKD